MQHHDPNPPLKNDDELEDGDNLPTLNDPRTWADHTVELEKVLKKIKIGVDPEFMVSLSVLVREPDWSDVFQAFSDLIQNVGPNQFGIHLTSTLIENDEEDELNDDEEFELVTKSLQEAGITGDLLDRCILQMTKNDIIFKKKS